MKESMGRWVLGEEELVFYPGAELFEIASRWSMARGDSDCQILETFEYWLPIGNFDNAESIRWQGVGILLKTCSSGIWEARIKQR